MAGNERFDGIAWNQIYCYFTFVRSIADIAGIIGGIAGVLEVRVLLVLLEKE